MTPVERVVAAYARIAEVDRPEVWISLRPMEEVLAEAALAQGPLAGKLLAVKDNIAVAGLPRTAGSPDFATLSREDAPVVARLRGAGAVVLGTTNLDQFATGLVGTRSPYGAVRSAHDPALISGGSSSGSAVAVALGIADLALGTDTAGSGRVPAALQGIVGIKPTRGLVPVTGVVPACRSFDCVTVLARDQGDAELAMSIMIGPDHDDPLSRTWAPDAPLASPPRPRVAVPSSDQLTALEAAWLEPFEATVALLMQTGAEIVPVDLAPFLEAAALLYGGGFVAERYAAIGGRIGLVTDPTVRAIIEAAGQIPAHRLVADQQRLDELRLLAMAALGDADVLLVPTTTHHPSIAEVEADPIGVNSRLGTFTNFANLLDLCAISVPSPTGVGVTVVGRPFADRVAADVARLITGGPRPDVDGPPGVPLVVVGAHLSGQPLNGQLTSRGARMLAPVRTAATYELYALDTSPPKPGLLRVTHGGASIEAELWLLPPLGLASLLAQLPAPLTFGTVLLEGGRSEIGFLVEPAAVQGAFDITHKGGWRAHVDTVSV